MEFKQGEKVYFVHCQTNNILYGFIDYQEKQYPNMTRIVKIRTCDKYNSPLYDEYYVLKDEYFKTFEEAVEEYKRILKERKEKYESEIHNINDLIQMIYLRNSGTDIATDFEFREVVKEKAKEYLGIDLKEYREELK